MRIFALLPALCVSACASGGSIGSSDVVSREPFVPIVPVVDLTPTGTASYTGAIGLQFLSPSDGAFMDLDGALSLNVNFDTMETAVTGAATGFQMQSESFVGNLLVNTGALDDSAGGLDFVTNINGSLQSSTATYLVLGQMRGEVLGAAQQAATGQIAGQVQERGRPADLSGQFQAARLP